MPRKRNSPNFAEASLGLAGSVKSQRSVSQALDWFTNMAARSGFNTPNLASATQYELVRFSYNYWDLITLYRNHWISRRIIDVPAKDMVRTWPRLTSDISPEALTKIDRVIRRTQTKQNVLLALQWARLFGGAGALMIIDGHENKLDEPLDLEDVPLGGYKGLIPFDRWAGIMPEGEVCSDITKPLDFNKPEFYTVRVQGGESFKIHASRLLTFYGPRVPTPEREAQSWWGISELEPVYEELVKRDNMSWNILNLTFRANILGMKFKDLASMLSGLGGPSLAAQKFEQRMSAINHLISNQSLVPLPEDGGIEAANYTFAGLSECYQQFQLDISGAAEIPVTRLWGRTITGLGQSNDADERIYEERIATENETQMLPQQEKLYPVLCMSELGEVPDDLNLQHPSVRVLDEKEKAELIKTVTDTVTVWVNAGYASPQIAAKEVKQASDITGIGTNLTDEFIASLPDQVGPPAGELDKLLGGPEAEEEGGETPQLSPSSSPSKVLRETSQQDNERMDAIADQIRKMKSQARDSAGWVGVDLDNTLAEYDHYRGDTHIGEPKQNGMLRLTRRLLRDGVDVRIFTARAEKPAAVRAIQQWCTEHLGRALPVTNVKDSNMIALYDDRAIPIPANDADGPSVRTFDHHGLTCVVETPKGSVRSGRDFAVRMPAHYGYVDGVRGADGDSLDMYYGDGPTNGWVYVVDQRRLDSKAFDEHKVMLNFSSMKAAMDAYMAGHHRSKDVYMDMTPMPISEFTTWAKTHDMRKPCGQ